jgi:hypothetical protein
VIGSLVSAVRSAEFTFPTARCGVSAKYAATFLMLAAISLLAASATGHAAAGACAALAFAMVAMSYAGAGPWLLLKGAGGRRRPWAWPLYWPYFLLNGLGLSLFRLTERHPPYVEVAPNLFLGRRLTAREARRDGAPRWEAVLDLAAEFPEASPLRGVANYRSLPVLDATAPTLEDLSGAVSWLAERTAEGPVYVHCALGHGRSATVVVAYLLATGRAATVDEALAPVRSHRPGVGLRAMQLDVLKRYSRVGDGDFA